MEETLVREADAATFEKIKQGDLNLCMGRDKNHVFVDGCVLKYADPGTFKQVNGYYWRDKNFVYLLGYDFGRGDYVVHHADPQSFAVMAHFPWSKDAGHVFCYVDSLPLTHPATFIVVDENWGKDGSFYYWNAKRIDSIDYATAQIVSSDYVKDKEHVFYQNMRVKDANPKTFTADGVGTFGHDDKYMFSEEKNDGVITAEYRKTYIDGK